MNPKGSGIFQVWLLQAALATLFCGLVIWFKPETIESALAGVLISLLPSLYAAWRLQQQPDTLAASQWLTAVYRVEVNKWIMTILLFAVVFSSLTEVNPVILFCGYLLSQVAYWLAPVLVKQ